jgi:hypothetical protein
MLDEILERAWRSLCQTYEVNGELPDLHDLFYGEVYSSPDRAAEAVMVNMIMEIMESVGRFSPWYRMPARAYGLTSVRDTTRDQTHWMLAPEAVRKWEGILRTLTLAIEKNSGLIQAMILVEGLVAKKAAEEHCVTARCTCIPPRSIHLERELFDSAEIICNLCRQPFLGE